MLNIFKYFRLQNKSLQTVNSVVKFVVKRLLTEYGEICLPSVFDQKQTSQAQFGVPPPPPQRPRAARFASAQRPRAGIFRHIQLVTYNYYINRYRS